MLKVDFMTKITTASYTFTKDSDGWRAYKKGAMEVPTLSPITLELLDSILRREIWELNKPS